VEGELIQTIYYNPNFHGSIPRNEDFEKLIQLFYDSNPQYKKKGALEGSIPHLLIKVLNNKPN
jgi:hypothetical protein